MRPFVTSSPFARPQASPATTAQATAAATAVPAGGRRRRRVEHEHGQAADEGSHRSDGEIDSARDDHEGHAERDDPGVRDCLTMLEQVLPLQKNGLSSADAMDRSRARRWRVALLLQALEEWPGSRSCVAPA